MKNNTLYKLIFLTIILFVININSSGQATLPFTYDGGNAVTSVTGLTQSGLGTDYTTSPKMKFDTTGDYLILNFLGVAGTLSFNIEWNQTTSASRFPGDFTLQESPDGVTYSTVQLFNSTNGTALLNTKTVSETFTTLLPTSHYLKWIYTSRTNGNIGIGAINLAAGNNAILSISTNSIGGYSYIAGNGPSVEQSFTVNGSNLYNNISITPPTDYEISKGTGAAFVATNPITLTQSGGTVNNTIIYSRLKQGLVAGNYNENITVSTVGANSGTIACSGAVTPNPTITLTDVTDPTLSTVVGSPVSQTLNVSGVNLSVDLGLSITGTDAGLFSLSQYSVNQTGGNVPNTLVTITYIPTIAGTNTAYLMMSSTGAMPVIRTLNGIATIATGLDKTKKSFIVTVENGNILFEANAGENVEIINSIGQILVQKQTVEGMNTIPVSTRGVLIVKVGSRVSKVILY
jgi:hypothetical protein